MERLKNLQIREASLSKYDFDMVAMHGGIKMLEKANNRNKTHHTDEASTSPSIDTGAAPRTSQADSSLEDNAKTADASLISGCAIHILKPDQLEAIKEFQGSCQKLSEGIVTLLPSVNYKGKQFPEEAIPALVFVFDGDPQGVLTELKWTKFPIWICQRAPLEASTALIRSRGSNMTCRFARVSGFRTKAFLLTPDLRAKYPGLVYARPVWVADESVVDETSAIACIVESTNDLEIAVRLYDPPEVALGLADHEFRLLAGPTMLGEEKVRGKVLVFAGNRKRLLGEDLC